MSSILAAVAVALSVAAPSVAQTIGVCPPRLGGTPYPGPYNVYFDFGKSVLDQQQIAEVRKRAKQAKDIYVTQICLVGFADKVGDPAANKRLGLARARTVANLLVSDGFSANNIIMDTGGEAYGRFNFGDVDRNKADRRVSIVFNR
ncbi:MAG: OmpA family protein [Alphaproteobacteria bacterium]|nr:OmpA family protein [Alphaproteobacteria bacterium]